MTPPKLPPSRGRRATALSVWLYAAFLHAYPAPFRRLYGSRMERVFRDSCRDALRKRGLPGLILLWLRTVADLVATACLERWHILQEAPSMDLDARAQKLPLRLWVALFATIVAFVVSLVASLNLYLLEDSSNLTNAAYSESPLLRFTYDGVYLSVLAAGVAVCAVVGYTIIRRELLVGVGLGVVALLVALGGFGGLLFRHAGTFLAFFIVFVALTVLSFLVGRAVASRAANSARPLGRRPAAVLGACVSVGTVLLVNVAALVLHTIALNPVSHALYMQGQIEGTHLNFTLIAMGIASLTLMACVLSLGYALRRT